MVKVRKGLKVALTTKVSSKMTSMMVREHLSTMMAKSTLELSQRVSSMVRVTISGPMVTNTRANLIKVTSVAMEPRNFLQEKNIKATGKKISIMAKES